MARLNCAKCGAECGLQIDGKLMIPLCFADFKLWKMSPQRAEMMVAVSSFLGRPHPRTKVVNVVEETTKKILSRYMKGMRKT